jgi:hypothetical protein
LLIEVDQLLITGCRVPISNLSKEIWDYARASEHLIGAIMRRNTIFSEEELLIVRYYTDEVVQIVKERFRPCGSELPK